MYKVLDDFCPKSFIDHTNIIFDGPIPWSYEKTSTGFDDYQKTVQMTEQIKETTQFVHMLNDPTTQPSPVWEMIKPILYFVELKTGITIEKIFRVKANLLLRDGSNDAQYNPPHIDAPNDDTISMIFYINNSDGNTRLFDKKAHQGATNLTVQKEVEPKAGRLFMFPSNVFHASSNPIQNIDRKVINFVVKPQKSFW